MNKHLMVGNEKVGHPNIPATVPHRPAAFHNNVFAWSIRGGCSGRMTSTNTVVKVRGTSVTQRSPPIEPDTIIGGPGQQGGSGNGGRWRFTEPLASGVQDIRAGFIDVTGNLQPSPGAGVALARDQRVIEVQRRKQQPDCLISWHI